jgi:uncharacterized heparinase superfamily protein
MTTDKVYTIQLTSRMLLKVAVRGREIEKTLRVFAMTTTVAMASITTAMATVTMPTITTIVRRAVTMVGAVVLLHIHLQEAP